MTEDHFVELLETTLKTMDAVVIEGEEFREPALEVLSYSRRPVRLHWMPVLGRGLSVVAVARQPFDLGFSKSGHVTYLTRVAMAVNSRFPPSWSSGVALGLTVVSLTSEPIGPDDDAILGQVVTGKRLPRQRALPLGLIRLNLGQEALAFALANGPDGVFREPLALLDALNPHFRRFVPRLEL
jgi:hypothetical protein